MRSATLLSTFWLTASLAAAQVPLRAFDGQAPGEHFGEISAVVGDVDADGFDDFGVGRPLDNTNGAWAGAVDVYSGRHGDLLMTVLGTAAGDRFGSALDVVGRVDADLHDDFVVGAPFDDVAGTDAGAAVVISGATGSVIRVGRGLAPFEQLGLTVVGAGDLDADGTPDFAAGAPLADASATLGGAARAFSGATGVLLRSWSGTDVSDNLGSSLARLGRVDADLHDDLAIGAIERLRFGRGHVRVVSGATGLDLRILTGPSGNAEFGSALAGGTDLDGDGGIDIVVGWSSHSPTSPTLVFQAGGFSAHSILDGRLLFSVDHAFPFQRLGTAVALPDDIDGDSRVDIAVGGISGGYELWSATGTQLARVTSPSRLGSVMSVGDADGDGRGDLLLAAPLANAQEAGRIELVGFVPRSLVGTPTWISVAAGGRQDFELDAGLTFGGRLYVIVAGASGIAPGLPLGAATLPINLDGFSQLSLTAANQVPFSMTAGTLAVDGTATAAFDLAPALATGLDGVLLDFAFLLLPGSAFDFASNPVPLRLVP